MFNYLMGFVGGSVELFNWFESGSVQLFNGISG